MWPAMMMASLMASRIIQWASGHDAIALPTGFAELLGPGASLPGDTLPGDTLVDGDRASTSRVATDFAVVLKSPEQCPTRSIPQAMAAVELVGVGRRIEFVARRTGTSASIPTCLSTE
jgi:hypothetical protein